MSHEAAEFTQWLRDLIHTTGEDKRDFAKEVPISPSGLSHLLNGEPPSVETCLRLAVVVGESPAKLLRMAGKEEMAKVLDKLYGSERRRDVRPYVTRAEKLTAALWTTLSSTDRRALLIILEALHDRHVATTDRERTARAAATATRQRRRLRA